MNNISVLDFVTLLWSGADFHDLRLAPDDIMERGRLAMWLDDRDFANSDSELERRQAASIIHNFLLKELSESDEESWGQAGKLLDLYDCRVCANHIAQVYAKGIMEAFYDTIPCFGLAEKVSLEEAKIFVQRVFDKKVRIK